MYNFYLSGGMAGVAFGQPTHSRAPEMSPKQHALKTYSFSMDQILPELILGPSSRINRLGSGAPVGMIGVYGTAF